MARRRVDTDGSYNTRTRTWITGCGDAIYDVHDPLDCAGEDCVVHNPSNHSMRSFRTHWRDDRRIVERICKHGCGHPDPDDAVYRASVGDHDTVHGCDGCCISTEDWDALVASYRSDVGKEEV